MEWILFNLRHFIERVYVFTNTKFNFFWQQRVPESKIFPGYHEGVLFEILEAQKAIMENLKAQGIELEERKRIARICIIMDDCITADLHHSEVLKTLFYEGRHLGILLFMSLQYAKGIPPGLRENCDMAFIFMLHSINQVEAVAENFLGHYDKDVAKQILKQCCWRDFMTDQRQCLVVNTSGYTPRHLTLFAALPQPVPDYILGSEEFWKEDQLPDFVEQYQYY